MQIVERSDEDGTHSKSSMKQSVVSDSERSIQTNILHNDPYGEFSEPWCHLRALSQGPQYTTVTSNDGTYTCRRAILVNHQIDALAKMVSDSTEECPSRRSTRTLDKTASHKPTLRPHPASGGSREPCHGGAELDNRQRSCHRSKKIDLEPCRREAARPYSDNNSQGAMTSVLSSSMLLLDKDLLGVGHWFWDKTPGIKNGVFGAAGWSLR